MDPKSVFEKYDKELSKKLPVDQPEFIALLEREKIIDEEAKKKMNSKRSKDIRADVVVGKIEESLPGREILDKLLVVMKEFDQGLEVLAREMENHLDPIGTPFECMTMAKYLSNNQHLLFQNLQYKKMRRYLITYGVLTHEQQSQIDYWNHDENYQIRMVISNIVNHLYSNRTSKLKGFLQLLEEDGDPDFKEAATRLGGSARVPTDPEQTAGQLDSSKDVQKVPSFITTQGTNDLITKVDYHRLLWQQLNKNFGDASSIFVMAVRQQLSFSDYSITNSLAAHNVFQLVDHIISCTTNYNPTGSLISRMWERLLKEKGQKAGPERLPAFEKAKYVLYADYGMRQITELYQDYLDKKIALKQKEFQMKQECRDQYGDQWQSIFNGWLLRSKEYIEFQHVAKVVHPHLDAIEVWEHGPLVHKLNQMKQVLEENTRSAFHDSGMFLNYYHVSLQPANWYQWFDPSQHPEEPWIQINVDSKNDDVEQAALYKKLGGSITHSQSDITFSLKVRAVQINRPWLDLSILENRNFTINGEDPGSWSTGELDAGNKGLFPLLTTQMIVARDITVTACTEMEQNVINDACSLFAVGSNSYKIINNNTIELKGTKLIGYVCTVVPKFPKQPIPNEIPQNAHEIPRPHDEHKKDNENRKANHLWTQEDLVQMVSSATKEAIPIPKNIEEEVRKSVVIWLVTMNTNETLATQVYLQQLDDKHVYKVLKTQNSQDITYYVGKYGNYPAALINVPTDFEIHDTTSGIAKTTFEYFPNIVLVINTGILCGVKDKVKMCNVLVSSEIVNYNKDGVRGEMITVSPQLTKLFTQSMQWPSHFIKKYLNDNQIPMPIVQSGVILSGPYLSEDHVMKAALVENVSPEAIGIEIEGMHSFNETQMTMRSTIIVKAVCDFKDRQKNEIYQPTAALLAAELVHTCLRSDQAHRIFEGKRVLLEMVQKAKDEGLTINVRHAKILFCGPPQVGKTSFSRLLRNKKHKEVGSTDAGHAKQVLISGKVNVIDTKWINLDRKLETHTLTEILNLKVHEQEQSENKNESQTKNDANGESITDDVQLPVQSNDQLVTENVNNDNSNSTIFQPKKNTPKSNTDIQKSAASYTIENKSIEEEMADISFLKLKESIPDTWDLFTLLDTGGQPEFINMLPAINASTDITFIVMDISEGREFLNTKIKAIYKNEKYEYDKQILKYTNRNLLNCLLSSIKVSSKEKDQFHPELIKKVSEGKRCQKVVYIIGTFADKLRLKYAGVCERDEEIEEEGELKTELRQKYDEEVREIDEEIKKLVKGIEEKGVIAFHCNQGGNYLKPIDNRISRDFQNNLKKDSAMETIQSKTTETVLRIREHCNEILHKTPQYEIPITWFLLELQLRKINKVCIPISEVKGICNEKIPSLKDNQIKEILKFYHLYGMLLYFDEVDGMNNYVITDPQWLFTNLTKIVMCQFKKDVKDIYGECYQEMCNGICDMELLNKFELDLHGIELRSFVKLLENFKIIAPMEDSSYFIPSMLPSCVNIENMFTEDEFGSLVVLTHDGRCKEVEPLLIEHTFGTIPRGLFGFLVVQLLQDNKKKYIPHGENDRSKKLFYRCADLLIFFVKPCFYVCICDRISYLEIKIRAKGNKPSYHYKAQNAITQALKKVCDRFDWSFKDCCYGFLCRNTTGPCAKSQHLTLLPADETSPPEDAYCKHNQWTELNVAHQIWFNDVRSIHYYKTKDENIKATRKRQQREESSDTESDNATRKRQQRGESSDIESDNGTVKLKAAKKTIQSTDLTRALSYACGSVSDKWNLTRLDSICLGDKKLDGSGTVIAILDTAIDSSCFTTKQKFSHIELHDFLKNAPVSSRDHGTICSAVAVGSPYITPSGLVIPRGVAPGAKLVVYRIADKGNGDTNAILNALEDIKQKGSMKVDVVSISYDLDEKYEVEIRSKIGELTEMGITFVAAAGNRGYYQPQACIPAHFDNVISVGALDVNGKSTSYTPPVELDAYAPGEFLGCEGTSYAAPAVAGLVLLLKQWADFIGSPAKENINRVDILRKIFTEDMFVKSYGTKELVDTSQPTVKKDIDGSILMFQPVDFFMNMKDHPEKLNNTIQKHLDDIKHRMED